MSSHSFLLLLCLIMAMLTAVFGGWTWWLHHRTSVQERETLRLMTDRLRAAQRAVSQGRYSTVEEALRQQSGPPLYWR